MKKFIILLAFFSATFAFDIDDLDRAVDLLNAPEATEENVREAYEIFSTGCEANEVMACEELGLMYINGQVSAKLDATLAKNADTNAVGLKFLQKSCELGYLNACSDILNLKEIAPNAVSNAVFERAKVRYDELLLIEIKDLNMTAK